MIRHLLKLAWHRKRSNALLLVEIAASFVVVFAVGVLALYLGSNWRRPLGYDWKDVWAISITDERMRSSDTLDADARMAARLLDEVRAVPGVVAAAGVDSPPYAGWTNTSNFDVNGRTVEFMSSGATVDADKVLGLRVIEGRWFSREDDARPWQAVVIDRDLAHAFYGDTPCVGRTVPGTGTESGGQEMRVVGVIDEFRKNGELAAPGSFLFGYVSAEAQSGVARTDAMVVRVPPGAAVALEEAVVARLRAVAPQWSVDVRTLEQMRASRLWEVCTPVVVLGIVAAFLLLMVGLGLIGVVWQNVARRTRELGLRRAMGATRMGICRQVLAELVLITAMAMLVGTVLVVQIPLFAPFAWLPSTIVFEAVLLAMTVILGIGLAAGLYPSWATTRIHPAEALHHD
jgi:putative ABC transport system permease protein